MIPVKEKEKRSFNSKNHKGMISWLLSLSLSLSFYSARAGRLKKRSEIVHIKPNGIFY
jgi:hypothetical protein